MKARLAHLASIAALAAIYFVTAKLGLLVAFPPGNATAVWAPSGISLAAVLQLGYGLWPGVAFGALITILTTEVSLPWALAMAAGNTGEILLAAFLIRRLEVDSSLARVRDVWKFLAIAGFASAVAATFGVGSLLLGNLASGREAGLNWMAWWLGDATSIIIITPLLAARSDGRRFVHSLRPRRAGEVTVFVAVLMLAGAAILGGSLPLRAVHEMPYALLIFPIWAAFRFGQRMVTASIGLLSAVAL